MASSHKFRYDKTSQAVARRYSSKEAVLKNLTKFLRKHLCCILFFDKAADCRPVTLPTRDFYTVGLL